MFSFTALVKIALIKSSFFYYLIVIIPIINYLKIIKW
jgi:hypothetical protein